MHFEDDRVAHKLLEFHGRNIVGFDKKIQVRIVEQRLALDEIFYEVLYQMETQERTAEFQRGRGFEGDHQVRGTEIEEEPVQRKAKGFSTVQRSQSPGKNAQKQVSFEGKEGPGPEKNTGTPPVTPQVPPVAPKNWVQQQTMPVVGVPPVWVPPRTSSNPCSRIRITRNNSSKAGKIGLMEMAGITKMVRIGIKAKVRMVLAGEVEKAEGLVINLAELVEEEKGVEISSMMEIKCSREGGSKKDHPSSPKVLQAQ